MKRSRVILIVLGAALALLVAGAGVAQSMVLIAKRSLARQAVERFPGDRIEALSAMASCLNCSLEDRNHAIWALGEFGDRRALDALESLRTGRRCDHAKDVCQYEVDKAVRKIEGTWGLAGSLRARLGRGESSGRGVRPE
jgi:hypothetical protein